MDFGTKIKSARKIKGFTQQELADMIGVKNTAVCNWENNTNKPDVDSLELLCGYLEISPAWLLSVDEQTEEIKIESETLEIIDCMNKLKDEDRKAIITIIKSLTGK